MRNTRELIVLCAALGACTYDFPDPYSGEVFVCEAKDDCADGFNCVNGICLDEATFGDTFVTIEGLVQAPAERVFTYVADRELSVPVLTGGGFAIQVPLAKFDGIVTLFSQGPSGGGSEGVQLASVLGHAQALLAAAGAARSLGVAQHPGVHLTPFTTMMYGGICAAGGGKVPSTRADLVRAEQEIEADLTFAQMLEGAAVLSSIVKSGGPVPNGFGSTLALACTPGGMRIVVNDIRNAAAPADPIAVEGAKLVADPSLVARFERTRLPSSYAEVLKSRRGFVGNEGARLVLDPAGSGSYATGAELITWVEPLSLLAWLVNAQGELEITMTSAVQEQLWMQPQEIAAYYSDSATQTAILSALGTVGELPITVTPLGMKVALLARGTASDWVATRWTRNYGFKTALEPYAISVPDVSTTDPAESRLWLRSEAMTPLAWPGGSPAGSTWAVPVVLPSDRASFDEYYAPGAVVETAVLMSFDAGGTATAWGGVLTGPTTYYWEPLGDGTVMLNSPVGWQQRVALWDQQGPEYGMLSWYPAGPEYLSYGRVIQRDPSLVPSLSLVVNQPGEYWMSGINMSWYPPEAGDDVPLDWLYGFEFYGDGTVTRRSSWFNADTNRLEWMTDTWYARTEGPELVIETRRDQYSTFSSCTPGGPDPSCFVNRWRRLLPVAAPGDRERLYVIESSGWLVDRITWDPVNLIWLDEDGSPADTSNLGYLFPPRIGIYLRSPIQTLP